MSDKPKYPADVIPGDVTSRRSTATTAAQPRGEVVPLRPKLLTDRAAAEYCARSPSWIRARRAADTQARRQGGTPSGPPWIVIGRSVFYKLADLDAWIDSNAVPYGKVFSTGSAHLAEVSAPQGVSRMPAQFLQVKTLGPSKFEQRLEQSPFAFFSDTRAGTRF